MAYRLPRFSVVSLLALAVTLPVACGGDEKKKSAGDGGTSDAAHSTGGSQGHDDAAAGAGGGQSPGDASTNPDGSTDPDGSPVPTGPCRTDLGVSGRSLEWQALPGLGGEGDGEDESIVMVDADGVLHVAARFYQTPARVDVFRYSNDAWELVGGESVGNYYPRGLAKDAAGTLFLLTDGSLYSFDGDTWNEEPLDELAGDAAALMPGELLHDNEGRLYLLMANATEARVFRRDAGSWEPLGGTLVPEPDDLLGNADWWRGRLAVNCHGHVAATVQGSVFLYTGSAWQALGQYETEKAANWPRIALGPDDRPVLTWRRDFTEETDAGPVYASELVVARYDAATSGFVQLGDYFPENSSYSAVAVNDAGDIFAAYRLSGLYLMRFRDGAWEPLIGDGTGHQPGTTPTIAIDPTTGLPALVWAAGFSCTAADDCAPLAVGRAVAQ